jgi:cobalt-zinc-cadmium efflux system outer membrane protein
MIERDVRAAWYRLAALEREQAVARASAALADEAAAWLRAAYEAGTASYAALLQAEMEAARLAVTVRDLEDRRQPAVAALNAAAGLPAGAPAPAAALPDSALLAAGLPDDATLAGLLQEGNPELAALAARRESSRLGAEAAGKAAGPSLSIGLDYIMTGEARMPDVQDSGKDPVIARVSVGIPLWGGPQAESRAAAGRARSAGAELGDRRLQLEARLEQGLYAWRDAGRRLDLQDQVLLPRAGQVIDVAAAAYAADQAAYGDLLAARRARLALENERIRAWLDRALALNDLAALVGLPPENLAAAAPAADAAPRPEERP